MQRRLSSALNDSSTMPDGKLITYGRVILEEILAQADRAHNAMMERIESERQGEPTAIAYENYYSDEGLGKKKRRKSRIRKFRSKYKTRKSNRSRKLVLSCPTIKHLTGLSIAGKSLSLH